MILIINCHWIKRLNKLKFIFLLHHFRTDYSKEELHKKKTKTIHTKTAVTYISPSPCCHYICNDYEIGHCYKCLIFFHKHVCCIYKYSIKAPTLTRISQFALDSALAHPFLCCVYIYKRVRRRPSLCRMALWWLICVYLSNWLYFVVEIFVWMCFLWLMRVWCPTNVIARTRHKHMSAIFAVNQRRRNLLDRVDANG